MKNKKACEFQICNICDAKFKMTRGCDLEKRCPACRLLGLRKPKSKTLKRRIVKNAGGIECITFLPSDVFRHDMILFDEEPALRLNAPLFGYTELDPFDGELMDEIYKTISLLNERERTIIIMRFGLNGMGSCTLEEIGEELGITRERARQIETRAIVNLKHPRISRPLKEYIRSDWS